MKIENIDLKEVLSSKIIFSGENYEKSPLSLYLNDRISKLKTKGNSSSIKEDLTVLSNFLSGSKTKLKEEVGQSLVKLFSIDQILKGLKPDHSVDFQKTLFDNPSLTFDLIEQMFKYGENIDGNKVTLNKELAEFASKVELNEPSIKETKLLNSGLRAIKNRSELNTFMLSELNLPLIVKKLEDEDSYFLNKEKLQKPQENNKEIIWKGNMSNFGSLLLLEKHADITSIKSEIDEKALQESIIERDSYFEENKLRLLTATEKSQYISVGKNYEIFKENVNSQSVVLFDENKEVEKILFNYSPVSKSIQIMDNEMHETTLMAACKFLSSVGIKRIELTDKGLKLNQKSLKNALLFSKMKEIKGKRSRQDNKRSGSF